MVAARPGCVCLIPVAYGSRLAAQPGRVCLIPTSCISSDQTNNQPVYGLPLEQHLDRIGQPVSMVIHDCCLALREKWMDTEGIFRIAAGAAKLKLLKVCDNYYNIMHTHMKTYTHYAQKQSFSLPLTHTWGNQGTCALSRCYVLSSWSSARNSQEDQLCLPLQVWAPYVPLTPAVVKETQPVDFASPVQDQVPILQMGGLEVLDRITIFPLLPWWD